MIVVDSDVAAELMRPAPAAAVVEWLAERSAGELYTTTLTLAEILAGIEALPRSRRKELVRATAVDVFAAFEEHVLDFDAKAGAHYATLVSARDRLGQPISAFDAQVAAICRRHQATLATGKGKAFRHTGVEVVDPWRPAPAAASPAPISGKSGGAGAPHLPTSGKLGGPGARTVSPHSRGGQGGPRSGDRGPG